MSTKEKGYDKEERRALSVEFKENFLYVHLRDGRYVSVPVTAYWRLHEASPEQREKWRISPRGLGIHWEEIDEDLSVSGLVRDFGARKVEYAHG